MNYTLITGGNRGIGKALAERCAVEGFNLLLVARSKAELNQTAEEIHQQYKVDVQVIEMDLLEDGAPEKLVEICKEKGFYIRNLINNAGLGVWGPFSQVSLKEHLEVIRLNQQVLVGLTYLCIPMLREFTSAHILNIASTAAYQPIPYFSVYAASKAFVLSFTQALRQELKRTNIQVTCLCPGPTESEFYDRSGFAKEGFNSTLKMEASQVADLGITAMLEGKPVVVPGFSNKLGVFLGKRIPRTMGRVVGNFFKPPKKLM